MSSLDDKQQLLQNTQALMAKVMEAADAALTFSKAALSYKVEDVVTNESKAEMIRLGTAALAEGARAATLATDLSNQCIEMAETLEDIYAAAEEERRAGKGKKGGTR